MLIAAWRSAVRAGVIALLLLACERLAADDVTFARPDLSSPISLNAQRSTTWKQGQMQVIHLQGNVVIDQQTFHASAGEAIIWIQSFPDEEESDAKHKLILYLEMPVSGDAGPAGKVVIDVDRGSPTNSGDAVAGDRDRIEDDVWFGRLYTSSWIDGNIPQQALVGDPPAIFDRARERLERVASAGATIQRVQFLQSASPQRVINPQTGAIQEVTPSAPNVPNLAVPDPEFQNVNPGGFDSGPPAGSLPPQNFGGGITSQAGSSFVSITARDSAVNLDLSITTNPRNPAERVWVGTGGVRVTIDSPEIAQVSAFQTDRMRQVVILADNVVAWQSPLPDGSDRWEIYLDGDVIFAKEARVIYAARMYYDANFQRGTILDADIYTPALQFQGLVRLKADVIQQVDENNLQAVGAAFTSSRLGVPRYWLQSDSIEINRQQNVVNDSRTGAPLLDPQTGQPQTEIEYFATSRANRVYMAGIPVFGWPRFKTSLNDPSLYLRSLRVGNDRIFGTQILTGWDMYKLLGIKHSPDNTEWIGILDYLSDRGIGVGNQYQYQLDSLFGYPGPARGQYWSWFIKDKGMDNLGRGRRSLVPEADLRGRILARHFHQLAPGFDLRAELGYISDRNFLESYYEREWDTQKDATTGFWLQRNIDTQSFNLTVDIQINDFFTQTSWWPRLDHFVLGQPLLLNRAVGFGRTHIGYAQMRAADPPQDPMDIFVPLPWEADVAGIRTGTRQEIDFPNQIGPIKVVPYALGDVTYWQEDLNGNDLLRAYAQVGVRASLPFWKVDPTVQSALWNVNGLAHKVTFDLDAYFADASQDLADLPLYDQLDDDAREAFRRRIPVTTFGLLSVPLRFDERFFALRNGMQGSVTAPSLEIADDLSVVEFGVRNRWQTKRGMPGNQRIIDWITLDVQTSLFPNPDRDNFGAVAGLLNYDFQWYMGDRTSLVSDGFFDFFDQGLRTASLGVQTSRPEVGNLYLGYRMIEGPISSNVITASVLYRMSEKWGVGSNSIFDFGETGTIGNTLSLIYIGESFLWKFGVNGDASRGNFGFNVAFEPRFIRNPRLFRPGGTPIPPAGSRWLE